jgi:hypothetical protein
MPDNGADVLLAVESVHTDDPYQTHGPCSRRCPFVLDEERRELDRELADRREEHGSVGWWL